MNVYRWFVVSSLALGVAGCATQQQPGVAPAKHSGKSQAAAKTPQIDEYEQMIAVCSLQGGQLTQFKQACAARLDAMNAWSKSPDGRKLDDLSLALTAAKTAKDDAQVKSLQEQIATLNARQGALRVEQRAKVMSVLTLAQQQQWAGSVLTGRTLGKGLRRMELTDDQQQKVQAICAKAAADFVKADTIARDPYLAGLSQIQQAVLQQITDTVLTAEQKAPPPAPTKAPSPAKAAKANQ